MPENSKPSNDVKKLVPALGRTASLFGLYLFFGTYIFGVQVMYDQVTKSAELAHTFRLGVLRIFLFTLVVFGAGLAWDVMKHMAYLSYPKLKVFNVGMSECLAYLAGYIALGSCAWLVMGPLAGPLTIGVLIYAGSSIYFLYTAITVFDDAVKSTLDAPAHEPTER